VHHRTRGVGLAAVFAVVFFISLASGSAASRSAPSDEPFVPGETYRALGSADQPFFSWGFEDGTLGPWDNFDLGTGTIYVASSPRGGVGPGIVQPTTAVAASGWYAVELTVTPTSHASPASDTDSVFLWNRVDKSVGSDGQETWERFKVRFPRAAQKRARDDERQQAVFVPNRGCNGGCPWFVEHHNDDSGLPFYRAGQISLEYPNLVWGVVTGRRLANGSVGSQIGMRVWGGDNNTPAQPNRSRPVWVYAGQALRVNHWYDFKVHVRWSPDANVGFVEWWLDGKLIYSQKTPTLWRHPDGSVGRVNFELVNYRPHLGTDSTIYFDDIRLGLTAASVGG
jgi:polysaccharide lyase-like protein